MDRTINTSTENETKSSKKNLNNCRVGFKNRGVKPQTNSKYYLNKIAYQTTIHTLNFNLTLEGDAGGSSSAGLEDFGSVTKDEGEAGGSSRTGLEKLDGDA